MGRAVGLGPIRKGRWLPRWLPPIAWAGGLLLLSAQPAERLPAASFWQIDKLAHALLYAALGGLTGRALVRSSASPLRWAPVLAAALLVGFGLVDEWSQSFTPGRMSSAADVVADGLGSCAGLFAASRYYCRRHASHPQLRR